jgi:hypothetical protein
MRASDLSAGLTALIPTRRPVYLWGPPGVGKSSLVRQAAVSLGLTVCDVRAVLLDPVDLRGIPAVNGDHRAHWCQPDFLPRDGQGVLFLDELAQAPPLVQSACLQLTLDRRIGEYTLPDGWTVIAASNRQEDRAGAHKLISPLLNRFVHLDLEVSVDDWQAWALGNGIVPDVRSFIRYRPGLLFQFDPTAGARSFPTPRSWEFVSQVSGATPDHLLMPVVAGCVGEGPAAEYIAFRRLFTQLPDPLAIISNPQGTTVPGDPAVLYALTGALVDRARKLPDPQLNSLGVFAGRMPDEYATLLVRDTIAVNPRFMAQPAVATWVRNHADLFSRSAA